MTHKELRAKIDEHIDYGTCGICDGKCYKEENMPWVALRAVVELPRQDNSEPNNFKMDFANMTPSQIAAECFTWGYATAMNKVIKTIEKELQ